MQSSQSWTMDKTVTLPEWFFGYRRGFPWQAGPVWEQHSCGNFCSRYGTRQESWPELWVSGNIKDWRWDDWFGLEMRQLVYHLRKLLRDVVCIHGIDGGMGRDVSILIHLTLDKMAAILADDISYVFSWMKMTKFWFEFHWNLFPGVRLTISQHWFR